MEDNTSIGNSSGSGAYSGLVAEFLARDGLDRADCALLVFKGFPLAVYQALLDNGVPYLLGEWDGEYPRFAAAEPTAVISAACSLKRMTWCFYEEFILLTNGLDDLSVVDGGIKIVNNNIFDGYYPLPLFPEVDVSDIMEQLEDEAPDVTDPPARQFYSDFRIESGVPFLSYVNRHFKIDTVVEIEEKAFYAGAEFSAGSGKREEIEISSLPIVAWQLQTGLLADADFVVFDDDSALISERISVLNRLGSCFGVSFSVSLAEERQQLDGGKYLDVLRRHWGKEALFLDRVFYKNPAVSAETAAVSQGLIISDIIQQCENAMNAEKPKYSDIIVTAPTGAGKSLLFQIPGIHLHEAYRALTIVVSPLVALMIDQVNELQERGVACATYLNSAITYEERQSRIEGIKNGEYSIVYLAPELLVSYDVSYLVSGRKIGLMVIDEAHLVTTWGRDFRVDYWFLGDHVERMRRGDVKHKYDAQPFPILCLTATAVFGGKDDVVGDLQSSLNLTCYSDHIYIGYVRRDNISFDIRRPGRNQKTDIGEKVKLTTDAIHGFIRDKQKTIVYFPYKSQIEDVLLELKVNYPMDLASVEKYYGGSLTSLEKNEAYLKFRNSESIVMLATKAFGMGINISDVANVYHFAPTGSLADYVQEIGRAARKLDSGQAVTDYLKTDMSYAKALWGLSGLRHYQLRAIMKKLYALYSEKKNRNLLFSPDVFGYLFDHSDVDHKVKSALMLLRSDLLEKYRFHVIAVRTRNLFAKQYVIVPKPVAKQFLSDYGEYCTLMLDCLPVAQTGHRYSTSTVTKIGDVYEIELEKLWETKFRDTTFAQFKYKFFSRELFCHLPEAVIPNIKLTINYDHGYEDAVARLTALTGALQTAFNNLKQQFGGKEFKFIEFYEALAENSEVNIRPEYARMLLDLFCYNYVDVSSIPSEDWKFIMRRKDDSGTQAPESTYAIRTNRYAYISRNLLRYLRDSKPNVSGSSYVVYLSIPKTAGKQYFQQLLASLMQLFDIASYELSGGKNPAILVRVNDPLKLRRLVESGDGYRNGILSGIEARHKRAVSIMNRFMGEERDNETRWQIIEDYFLGKDEKVDRQLGIPVDQ
ncbi:MAG: DEAD/DEAH box helicase [Clostridiales bacterium]|nr:DEAD/DEAH box helicase [Clostridiales bacterium]